MTESLTGSKAIPKWVRSAIIYWWLAGASLVVLYWTANQLRSLLVQLLIALFLSLAMHPAVEKLHARGMKRGIATGITMAITLTLFILFLAVMGALVVSQLRQLVEDAPSYATSISSWLKSNFDISLETDRLVDELQGRGGEYIDNVADGALDFSSFVIGFLFQLLTVSLFAFYLSADGPRIRRVICSLLPEHRQVKVLRIWELAIDKTGAFISSRVVLAVASAVFHWLVFSVIGLPSPLALALWVGIISQFVPVIGTYISGVLPVLIALANEPITAVYVIAAVLFYQQIENYLLQPRITAQTLNMHPAVAFGGVIAGSSLLGATGAFLALPAIAIVQAAASVYIQRHNVVDSDLLDRRSEERDKTEAESVEHRSEA